MHHGCEEEEMHKYNFPQNGISVITGILTDVDENIFSRILTESAQLNREKTIIGATTANNSPYLMHDMNNQ